MAPRHGVVGAFALLLTALVWAGRLPAWLGWSYLLLSVLAVLVYAHDKRAAQRGAQRVPENTLHLLALCGGWPGAWLARFWLRHKTVKQPFIWRFWLCVVANVTTLGAVLKTGLLAS